jgi:hypothetical protein
MEQYLIDQYGVIEDEKYLTSVDEIEDFVRDLDDLFDCGQGYYQEEAEVILKIGDKFYAVKVKAEIVSSKQDRGDRLYWVERIESVTYREIEKPQPKEVLSEYYRLEITADQKKNLEMFLKEYNMEFSKETK